MKILLLNGSPRKTGNVSTLLDVIGDEAELQGHEVIDIKVSNLKFSPCIGCMKCRTLRECCLPDDDAHRVGRMLGEIDALVVGAPCYWGNLPGHTKMLFDRLVYALMEDNDGLGFPHPLHKGKRAIVVATSTAVYPFNRLLGYTSGVVSALKKILHTAGFKVVATVQCGGTKNREELSLRELKRYRKLVKKL